MSHYFSTALFTKSCLAVALFFVFAIPQAASAAVEVSAWVPWWQVEKGTDSAKDNIRDLDTIYPFVYEVSSNGDLIVKTDLSDRDWRLLFRKADRKNVEVIPTIAWFDGASIHRVLSTESLRRAHIAEIVDMVDDGDFDGVDIDYESKLSETKDFYVLFLKELKAALEDESSRLLLTCTIEPRTPPASKWRTPPAVLDYANDYVAIGTHCDRIEIMAYDQQRIDFRLNTSKSGEPYNPVADADWVEKVIVLALQDIPAEKIWLGVPTYGRNWEVEVAPDWYKDYTKVSTPNLPDFLELADDYDVTPGRNKAGELSYTYFPESSVWSALNVLPTPEGTRVGNEAAAKALLFATFTGMTVPVNYVTMSDASAIDEKIDLVEKYNLRGIAIFKIDGEEDEDIWDLF